MSDAIRGAISIVPKDFELKGQPFDIGLQLAAVLVNDAAHQTAQVLENPKHQLAMFAGVLTQLVTTAACYASLREVAGILDDLAESLRSAPEHLNSPPAGESKGMH
ncbi:MAG: hypothetical protein KF788_08665 [Piscinibacter sp.]|nr:hypothetical protein [Piscinibacter sp.]